MIPGLPGGPVVNNLPCTAEDAGSIPDPGTNIPYVTGQLSLCTTARVHALQQKISQDATKIQCAATKI